MVKGDSLSSISKQKDNIIEIKLKKYFQMFSYLVKNKKFEKIA